jgi:hypothetical protein
MISRLFAIVSCWVLGQALAWRNKSFGTAIEVVWSKDGDYATRDAPARIKLFRDFKERQTISLGYTADAIFGGAMLGVRSGQDFVFFYDWETGAFFSDLVDPVACPDNSILQDHPCAVSMLQPNMFSGTKGEVSCSTRACKGIANDLN